MIAYAFKRLLLGIFVAFLVSAITFGLLHAAGDPARAMAGEEANAETIEALRKHFGFDRPLIVQYGDWLGRALRGDLGMSIYLKVPVVDAIAERAPTTLQLASGGLAFALLLSIPLGILAACHRRSMIDRIALMVAATGQAIPSFFLGLLLILIFGVQLQWLPVSGGDGHAGLVLPSIALGYVAAPAIMRLTRAGMIEVLGSDYIRTAHAKGLGVFSIIFKHALRNALAPVVAISAVQLGWMLSGSIVIETVFTLNGIGRLAWQSVQRIDLEMMQGIVLVISGTYVVLIFLSDVVNALLDPKIRSTAGMAG